MSAFESRVSTVFLKIPLKALLQLTAVVLIAALCLASVNYYGDLGWFGRYAKAVLATTVLLCQILLIGSLRSWQKWAAQDFEQILTAGRAHWIKSFNYERNAAKLTVGLTDNVDSPNPTQQVEFLDIQNLEITWTDRDDNRIEGLVGAHEDASSGAVHYRLVTEQREIKLTTPRKAVVRGCVAEAGGTRAKSDAAP